MANDDVILQIAEPVSTIACRKCGQAIDIAGQPVFEVILCPSCTTAQKVPVQLGHFLLFDVLGRGGMAAVYRALDRTLGRQVAIKVMRGEMSEDPQFVANFLREARSAAQINHPNIVQIYAVDESGGHPYIVMELLDGGRMDEMISKGDPLDEMFVLKSGLDAAEGLGAATDRGLIHGDVKPANILYDRAGTAKIADFGLARFQQKPMAKGEIWGTPYYIAPEKVRDRKEDHRSDIYSLGATLYHALALKPPFEGQTATDVVLARLKEPPPSLETVRPDLHPATRDLILRMLEPDPFRRYPTYASLISDIRETMEKVKSAREAPVAARKPHTSRKGLWIGLAVVAVLALAAAGTAIALRSKRRPAPTPPPAATGTVQQVTQVRTPAVQPVQPFSAAEQDKLAKAFEAFAGGDVRDGEQILVGMVKDMPIEHGGRAWIALLLAVPPWTDGNADEVYRRVSKLVQAKYDAQSDGSPHPSLLPQSLAAVATGQPFREPAPAPGAPWPAWYGPLARFFQSGSSLAAGKIDQGLEHLDAYLALQTADPRWPAGLQPVARKLRQQAVDWKTFRGATLDRVRKGQGEAVFGELQRKMAEGRTGILKPDLSRLVDDARKAHTEWKKGEDKRKKTEAEKRQQAEAAERKKKAEDDLQKVADYRGSLAGWMARRDFRGALDAARTLESSVGGEAKEGALFWVETAEALNGLRDFLAERIKASPMRGPQAKRDFGGDVIAASAAGLAILIGGGAGTAERSWDSIHPRVYAELCAHYIRQAGDADKARYSRALAVYTHNVPALRPMAGHFAAAAFRAQPAMEAAFRKHAPDLLPKEAEKPK
ncbi:MAG: hypothetical protein FJ221_09155 [Lentisphaerae bacterium]|nr:hypothetical protein [Lentisphaerota bacterium]